MPKLKTVKSASKRVVGLTKAGKVRVRRMSAQHLATNKSNQARHVSNHSQSLTKTAGKKVRQLVPYL